SGPLGPPCSAPYLLGSAKLIDSGRCPFRKEWCHRWKPKYSSVCKLALQRPIPRPARAWHRRKAVLPCCRNVEQPTFADGANKDTLGVYRALASTQHQLWLLTPGSLPLVVPRNLRIWNRGPCFRPKRNR